MMLTKSRQLQKVRLFLLIAEIEALKKCMINVYEQSESLHDPILIQLSEMLDRKLNKFIKSQN
ncbi:Spo0E like sporulation regulatory protein [Paenibacillus sp. 1_12]|uniref:aspartyl-phosphate phosphatase Spo0E family protein n=1 Tax=Paenibacillus sp. 1_12 TaxID=1566278 RepID=UPI0008E45125|nr:aspartyl-phosphate phosphatase Spo0E family protein [Paenibacillus sp. 1_12]SFL42817.1 Spo0E like sporulation regulatory protein [Paenibacillus sp. 1_12]